MMTTPSGGIFNTIKSQKEPTHTEIQLSQQLIEVIQSKCQHLSISDSSQKSNAIILEIRRPIVQWLCKLCEKKDMQVDGDTDFGVRLEIFGGQLLGVATADSDLDIVCITPRFVEPDDFYTSLPSLLLQDNHNYQHIRVVSGARVPHLEFSYKNTKVDLLLCVMSSYDVLPLDLNLHDNSILEKMSKTAVYSLNGYRETHAILQLVPDQESFVTTLNTVKLWAKCQHIYHGILGYLGGFAWAILVVYICQQYPTASPALLLHKFFVTFSHWEFRTPVMIAPLKETDHLDLGAWNPLRNHSDSLHEWPIITPAYPAHNAAFNINKSTFAIIKSTLSKAATLTEKILKQESTWNELFVPHSKFFISYKHFLVIGTWANTEEDLLNWSGLMEAQLRLLLQSISRKDAVVTVHPFPERLIPLQARCGHEVCWVIGLTVDKSQGGLDISEDVLSFKSTVLSAANERSIYKHGMMFDVKHIKRSQLRDLFEIR